MKLCIFGIPSGAFFGKHPGGSELQSALFARAAAFADLDVTVYATHLEHAFHTIEGVRLLPIPGWNQGLKGLRFFTHKLPGMIAAAKQAQADVFYGRGLGYLHIFSLVCSRKMKVPFIYSAAGDTDFIGLKGRIGSFYKFKADFWQIISGIWLNELASPILLAKADVIFTQHEGQSCRAQKMGKKSIIFNNIIDLPKLLPEPMTGRTRIIFVGSLKAVKGVNSVLKLARDLPSIEFDVVGQPLDTIGRKVFADLKKLKNVETHGQLSSEQTLNLIRQARALISTSISEGYPNVFLEAWSVGVPVVSLHVDPGGVLEKNGLGIVCHGNLEDMKDVLRSSRLDQFIGRDLQQYVLVNHSMAYAAKRIKEVLPQVIDFYQSQSLAALKAN
jgi:glycosyltransferase involved in cell wall biosynthesis